MKAAVSIPEDVFKRADRLARCKRQSRSSLYAEALQEYLVRHEDKALTETMRSAIEDAGRDLDAFVKAAGERTLRRIEWKE